MTHLRTWYVRTDTKSEIKGVVTFLNDLALRGEVQGVQWTAPMLLHVMTIPYAVHNGRPARNDRGEHEYAILYALHDDILSLPACGYPAHSRESQVFAMADLWSSLYDPSTHLWKRASYKPDFDAEWQTWAKRHLEALADGRYWHTFDGCAREGGQGL